VREIVLSLMEREHLAKLPVVIRGCIGETARPVGMRPRSPF